MELGNVLTNLCGDSYLKVMTERGILLFSGYAQHCTLLEDFKVRRVLFNDDCVTIVLVNNYRGV